MYAVIDIGSNTVRLVLYKVIDGELRQMLNSKEPAGLAGYIDSDRRMTRKGVERLLHALRRFELVLEHIKPRRTFVFATASLRGIVNTAEVLSAVRTECAMEVNVISGEEEAMLDFSGARRTLSAPDGLMVDIGGGSTELVAFRDGEIREAVSLPIGSLNMFTKYVSDVIPTRAELKTIRRHAASLMEEYPLHSGEGRALLCGVGGTCRASCKLSDELFDTDHGYSGYPAIQVKGILKLVKTDRERLVGAIIKSAPDRLHTLLPGMAILSAVIERYGCEHFVASPYGVREGYLLEKLEETGHDG